MSVSQEPIKKVSIFDTYSKSYKTGILLACAGIALLTPFTDTIYLPALKSVGSNLHASDANVALSISAYLAAAAVGQLVWGSLSDYYGRTVTLYIGIVLYEIITIGCIFADTIQTLIALRTVEGFVIGSTIVSVSAVIADVFAPAERGTAMGAFLVPLLIGPVIAPVIGGALAEAYNWRATFVLLAGMTVPLSLWAVYVLPETHHWFVVQRVADENKKYEALPGADTKASPTPVSSFEIVPSSEAAAEVEVDLEAAKESSATAPTSAEGVVHLEEAEGLERERLVWPWESLGFILESQLTPSYVTVCTTFSAMFMTLVSLPLCLAEAPYNYSTTLVGVLFLPGGIAMLLGAMFGGASSDASALAYPKAPEGRLVYSIPFMLLVPIGSVGFGFSLDYGANLGYVLVAQCVMLFGQAAQMPTILGYLTAARPKSAAAVGSVMTFMCFAGAAVCIAVSDIIISAVTLKIFYVILAGLTTLSSIWSIYDIASKAF